jgi:hypothetical protein
MGIILLALATLGFFGVLCNLVSAAGSIICVLLKYIILPLGVLFFLCGIATYGL